MFIFWYNKDKFINKLRKMDYFCDEMINKFT